MRSPESKGFLRRALPAVLAASAVLAACGEEPTPPAERIAQGNSEAIAGMRAYNESCAREVLKAAEATYGEEVKNDPATEVDEAYEARQKQATEGPKFVEGQMTDCMATMPGYVAIEGQPLSFEFNGEQYAINVPQYPQGE